VLIPIKKKESNSGKPLSIENSKYIHIRIPLFLSCLSADRIPFFLIACEKNFKNALKLCLLQKEKKS